MPYERLCGIAVNRLHLTVADFYGMSPIEYDEALNDWGEQLQLEVQSNYNVARWLARHLWNMQGRHLKRMIQNPQDLEEFKWDRKQEQTKEQIMAAIKTIFGGMRKRKK